MNTEQMATEPAAVNFALSPLVTGATVPAPKKGTGGVRMHVTQAPAVVQKVPVPSAASSAVHNVCKKGKKWDRVEDPRRVAISFASAVTASTPVGWGWVARNGEESLFSAFQRILPEVIQPGDGHHRYRLKGKISCPEFNKVLQAFCGFICARTRKKSLTRTAGNWLFCNRRWLDPSDPSERAVLEYNYEVLAVTYPIFTNCGKAAFLHHLSQIVSSWSERMKDASRKKGGVCSPVDENPCLASIDHDLPVWNFGSQLGEETRSQFAKLGSSMDRRETCEEILVGAKRKRCDGGSNASKSRKAKESRGAGIDPHLLEAAEILELALNNTKGIQNFSSDTSTLPGDGSGCEEEDSDSSCSSAAGKAGGFALSGESESVRAVKKRASQGDWSVSADGHQRTYRAVVAKEETEREVSGIIMSLEAGCRRLPNGSSALSINQLLNPPVGDRDAKFQLRNNTTFLASSTNSNDVCRTKVAILPDYSLRLPPLAPEFTAAQIPLCGPLLDGKPEIDCESLEALSAVCEQQLASLGGKDSKAKPCEECAPAKHGGVTQDEGGGHVACRAQGADVMGLDRRALMVEETAAIKVEESAADEAATQTNVFLTKPSAFSSQDASPTSVVSGFASVAKGQNGEDAAGGP